MQLVFLILTCLNTAILVGFGIGIFLATSRTGAQDAKEAFYMGEIQKLIDKNMSKNYVDYAQGKVIETPVPLEAEPAYTGGGPDGLA